MRKQLRTILSALLTLAMLLTLLPTTAFASGAQERLLKSTL